MKDKFIIQYALIAVSVVFIQGCFDPPEFPVEPKVSANNVSYASYDGPDSLILTFNFEDGDGDIGLGSEETQPPYHRRNFIIDSSEPPRFVSLRGEDYTLPFYAINEFDETRTLWSESDDRPAYNCLNYEPFDSLAVQYDDSTAFISDTLYVVKNEFNKNIYVSFYRKVLGEYSPITDKEFAGNQECPDTFDSRFPIFDNRNIGRALSGTISYAMISVGFETIFRNDSIMIEFYIYDRALNRSNIARTEDFVLADIQKN